MQGRPGQIKRKCLPSTTLVRRGIRQRYGGRAADADGQPLSSKLKAQLKKGKTIHLTATLTYQSSLGGAPTVQTYPLTVKGKRPHHRKP